jgi:hypothetical protein
MMRVYFSIRIDTDPGSSPLAFAPDLPIHGAVRASVADISQLKELDGKIDEFIIAEMCGSDASRTVGIVGNE